MSQEENQQNTHLPEEISISIQNLLDSGKLSPDQAANIITTLDSRRKIDSSTISKIAAVSELTADEIKRLLLLKPGIAEMEVFTTDENIPLESLIDETISEGEFLGSGQLADVFRSKVPGETRFCIKNIARSNERSAYTNSVDEEMKIQQVAQSILAQASRSEGEISKAPKVILYVKTEKGSKSITMEFVPGKTLWRLVAEQVIRTIDLPAQYRVEDLLEADDGELNIALLDALKLKNSPPVEQYKQIVNRAKKHRFLNWSIYEQLSKALKVLKGNNFYHRDLHENNFMVTPEGQTYIIDFGTSIQEKIDDPYNVDAMGRTLSFTPDESILSLLKDICIIPEEVKTKKQTTELMREKRNQARYIKWLTRKTGLDITNTLEKAGKQATSADELIELIITDKLRKLIDQHIGNPVDVDILVNIVKIISFLEKTKFGSSIATKRFFAELAVKSNNFPLQNMLRQI